MQLPKNWRLISGRVSYGRDDELIVRLYHPDIESLQPMTHTAQHLRNLGYPIVENPSRIEATEIILKVWVSVSIVNLKLLTGEALAEARASETK